MKRVFVVGRITAPRKAGEPPWSAGSRQIVARADLGYRDAMNFRVNIHPGEPPEMMVVALRETFRSIDRHRLT